MLTLLFIPKRKSGFTIHRIYYENFHQTGDLTSHGVQNFTFWGSNDATAFATLTYVTDTNWTQINTYNITGGTKTNMDRHVDLDQPDPKYLYCTENTTSYRYYAFKFADTWGVATNLGIRHLELQRPIYRNCRKGIILNDGANLTTNYLPVATTNGRLMDSIITQDNNIIYLNTLSATTIMVTNISTTNISAANISTATLTATTLTATTIHIMNVENAIIEASGGTLVGDKQFVEAYLSGGTTTTNLLENGANWVDKIYIGVALTETYQGQKHYDANYFYEAVADNLFIRWSRV